MLWICDILVPGSESADPYHRLTDLDLALFVSGFQDANKTKHFVQSFFDYYFFIFVGTFYSSL
jgi:hypothetical protein